HLVEESNVIDAEVGQGVVVDGDATGQPAKSVVVFAQPGQRASAADAFESGVQPQGNANPRVDGGAARPAFTGTDLVVKRGQVLPFFRKRKNLAALIASYSPNVIRLDRIAFEFPLFGDFTCDLAVGDSVKHAYCFIDFEDAGPNSLFVRQGKKATREWSSRFD